MIQGVFADAWALYRLLFRRSVLVAAIVFALITLLSAASRQLGQSLLLGLVSVVGTFAGPVVVQGALVALVRNIHEGHPPEGIRALYATARSRFWSLLGASLVYGIGIVFGLFLLIVPGIFIAARWCLMAPAIVLDPDLVGEGHTVMAAKLRSSELIRGQTAAAASVVVRAFLLLNVPYFVLALVVGGGVWVTSEIYFLWYSLTSPFAAHLLTVIYYRRTDPTHPVINPAVKRWASVWIGA